MLVLSTIHPARTFRSPYLLGPLRSDVRKFARMLSGAKPAEEELYAVDVGRGEQAPPGVLQHITSCTGRVAFDFETDGKNPDTAWVTLCSLGCEHKAVSFHNFLHVPPEAVSVLEDRTIEKITQNGPGFDHILCRAHGIKLAGTLHDLKDLRKVAAADSPLGLAYIASIHLLVEPWKVTKTTTQDPIYNAKDALYTAQCFKAELDALIAFDPDWWFQHGEPLYRQQFRLSQFCAEMRHAGIAVDPDRQRRLSVELALLARKRRAALRTLVGPSFRVGYGCLPPNPDDLRAVVWAECAKEGLPNFGVTCPPPDSREGEQLRTDAGTPRVDQTTLLTLMSRAGCPDALKQLIVAYWAVTGPLKLRSTFVRSERLQEAIGHDGRLRASWNSSDSKYDEKDSDVGGAATGRLTCAHPNLMNIPKANKKQGLPNIRSMYVPAPGHSFVELDYSAAELHMLGCVANDTHLLEMLSAGDVHTATAVEWFGLPPDTTKETCPERVRRTAKEVRFASNYRAEPPKVWTRVVRAVPDITLREVSVLHSKFRQAHPLLVKWWGEEHTRVLSRGYSETRIMHRRRIYPTVPEPTKTANQPIQGTVGDLINSAVVGPTHSGRPCVIEHLARWGHGGRIVAQVHDSLLIEVLTLYATLLAEEIAAIMAGPWNIEGFGAHLFPVEWTVCSRWGEK